MGRTLTPDWLRTSVGAEQGKVRSGYVDETYIRVLVVGGIGNRAIDRAGALVGVMCVRPRPCAAKAFFRIGKGRRPALTPDRVTTDGHAALSQGNPHALGRHVRQSYKALSEHPTWQDHAALKGDVEPMLG